MKDEQQHFVRMYRTRRRIAEAVFWAAFAGSTLGFLASRPVAEEPEHKVPVSCETGELLDVLASGSAIKPTCFATRP